MIVRFWIQQKNPKKLIFLNYCSMWRALFPTKEASYQIELFGEFFIQTIYFDPWK